MSADGNVTTKISDLKCSIIGGKPSEIKINTTELAEGKSSLMPEVDLRAVKSLSKLLALAKKDNPKTYDTLTSKEVMPILLTGAKQSTCSELQQETVHILSNITVGQKKHIDRFIEAGCVPMFVNLMDSPLKEISDHAVWALRNISSSKMISS